MKEDENHLEMRFLIFFFPLKEANKLFVVQYLEIFRTSFNELLVVFTARYLGKPPGDWDSRYFASPAGYWNSVKLFC